MALRSGLEGRFLGRFVQREQPTNTDIGHVDSARSVAEQLNTAIAVIDTQKKNIDELFLLSVELVNQVDVFQQTSGERQVRNLFLPTDEIRNSYGMKLGYVKMCLSFFNAGMLHFMEEGMNIASDLKATRGVVEGIASHDCSVSIIGEIVSLDIDSCASTAPITETRSELTEEPDVGEQAVSEANVEAAHSGKKSTTRKNRR